MKYLLLILLLIGCSTPAPNPGVTFYWGEASVDSALTDPQVDMTLVMRISDGIEHEIWRVEWCPMGSDYFTPIAYGMIPHGYKPLPYSGIVMVKVSGIRNGDQIMIWRSEPWPGDDNLPDINMRPVR